MYPLSSKTSSVYADLIIETNAFTQLGYQNVTMDRLVFENIVLLNKIPGITPLCRFSKQYKQMEVDRYYHTSGSLHWMNYLFIASEEGQEYIEVIWQQLNEHLMLLHDIHSPTHETQKRSRFLSIDHFQISDIYHGKGYFDVYALTSNESDAIAFNHLLNGTLNDVLTKLVDSVEQSSLFEKVRVGLKRLIRQEKR